MSKLTDANNIRMFLNLVESEIIEDNHKDDSTKEKNDEKEILFGDFEELVSELVEIKEKILALQANKNKDFNEGFDLAISRIVEIIENTLYTKFNKRI